MKVLFPVLMALSMTAQAGVTLQGTDNLEPTQQKILRDHLQTLARVSIWGEDKDQAENISVKYFCSNVPVTKAYCSVDMVSEFGSLGAATVIFDTEKNTAGTLDKTISK